LLKKPVRFKQKYPVQGETLLGACIPEKKGLFLRWRIEITAGFADNESVMKIQLSNPLLREFFEQLRFVSKEQEQKVLDAAESLLMVIDPDREYPYDFVVFRLSGVRPRSDDLGQTIPGRQILADLRVWLTMKTASIAIPAPPQAEGIYTIEQLAAACSVSTKTIRRWQRRGLVGRMYVFADGKKRLGFSASMVEQFKATHGALIQQAQHFRQLSSAEKKGIVEAFRVLAEQHPDKTRNQLIAQLVYQTGRARETIRYVLAGYEKRHPHQPLPIASRGRFDRKEMAQVYKLYRQGQKISELAARFQRTRVAIYRGITRCWAHDLLSRKISYIPSLEFESAQAEQTILGPPLALAADPHKGGLARPQEQQLFCRYNYLKYLAETLRGGIRPDHASLQTLKKIDKLLDEAEQIRRFLVEVNMPLVAGIAGKHLATGAAMSELLSEGAVSMMRAVDKFDYTRGYRFSTYASWVIAKDFARKIPAESARLDRITGSDLSEFSDDARSELLAHAGVLEKASQDLRQVIDNTLDERERYVVMNHFAIDSGVIRKKPKTLKQIGDELGLTKERVRQIELQALQKLRHSLSPEQFDLLTG